MRYLSYLMPVLLVLTLFSAHTFAQANEVDQVGNIEESAEPVDILPQEAVFIGEEEENGVLAMTWLYRVPDSAIVEERERSFPYILFARFLSVESNVLIEKGIVAYKIETRDGMKTSARKMDFKSGYFVVGLNSPVDGSSILHIGCKLEDEKKRQFRYNIKVR